MKKLLFALCALCMAVLLAGAAHALEVPPNGGQWVVDNARLLPAREKNALAASLRDYAGKTTNQIVVLTIPSLEGEDVAAYANKVARAWGVGQKDKNNGVLILVAKAEGKVRFEVGRGIEDKLPDVLARRIQQDITVPHFRSGRFGPGLTASVQAIQQALAGNDGGLASAEADAANATQAPGPQPGVQPTGVGVSGFTVLLVIVAVVLASMLFGGGNPFFLLGLLFSLLSIIGRGGRGGGGFGGGDGGFGGGGGDFGGGGGSSDWGDK